MDKDYFVNFLMEHEGKKRIESFFLECFFEKEIERNINENDIASNWLHSTVGSTPIFFKLLGKKGNRNISVADRKFTKHIIENGLRAIYIFCESTTDEFEASEVSGVTDDFSFKTLDKERHSACSFLLKILNRHEPKLYPGVKNKPLNPEQILAEELFDTLGVEAEDFLISRKFIYEVLYPVFGHHPCDIDSIIIRNSRIVCLEFKRKIAAKGYFKPRNGTVNRSNFLRYTQGIDRILGALGSDIKRKQRFGYVVDYFNNEGFDRKWIESYGLDCDSHTPFLRWCTKTGLGYQLIHLTKSSKDPRSYLNFKELTLNSEVDFSSAEVTPEMFNGITYTNGDDSGMNDNTRIQETIEKTTHFKDYEKVKSMTGVFVN